MPGGKSLNSGRQLGSQRATSLVAEIVMTSGRDWRVDALRGYFLAIMMVAHLPSNPLRHVTHYAFGFFSAPDGFVFLSGMTCGWVYLRLARRHGFAALEKRIQRRFLILYCSHILLVSFYLLQPRLLELPGARLEYARAHPFQAWMCAALFLYQPRFLDILPMYCVFLLFVPIVLKQMSAGRAWFPLAASAILWTMAQFGVGDRSTAVFWLDLGRFNLLAWQAYFFVGLYLGYRRAEHSDCVVPRWWWLFALCGAVVVALFIVRHDHTLLPVPWWWAKLNLNPDRSPIRFLNFACAAYVFSFLPRRFDNKVESWKLSRFFSLLGRHSLPVFCWSVLVSSWALAQTATWEASPAAARIAMTLVGVLVLAVPALVYEQYRSMRRRVASVPPVLARAA